MADIRQGHVLDRLKEMPGESVHCVVTSPPYWGLRDYGSPPQIWGGDPDCDHDWGAEQIVARDSNRDTLDWKTGGDPAKKIIGGPVSQGSFCRDCGAWRGALGLEPDWRLYLDHLVMVFREVRRVLRRDGTLWLNLGDSYATGAGKAASAGGGAQGEAWDGKGPAGYRGRQTPDPKNPDAVVLFQPNRIPQPRLKPKDLCGIPWAAVFALRDDGWWLRRDVIWAKQNPMPESTEDRCTTAHEYLFHLAKSETYFYDGEAIKEPAEYGYRDTAGKWRGGAYVDQRGPQDNSRSNGGSNSVTGRHPETGRNKRSVWTIATEPFPEAHFATFPAKLVEPCILAGTSARGVCPVCAAPWVREVERTERGSYHDHAADLAQGMGQKQPNSLRGREFYETYRPPETIGWQPSCPCGQRREPVPATVLDPFLGSGTTAMVAERLARRAIGIELNPQYIAMAERRAAQPGLMLA